jgi:hypothetical protein
MKKIYFVIALVFLTTLSYSQVLIDTITYPFGIGVNAKVPTCMSVDQTNNEIWIGTTRNGVMKFDGSSWIYFNTTNSLIPSDTISSLHRYNGNVFIGMKTGLSKFDGANWSYWNKTVDGIASDTIRAITAHNNEIWIGTYNGISHFNGSAWTNYSSGNSALGCDTVNDIIYSSGDTIWIATNNGLFYLINGLIYNQDINGGFLSDDNSVHKLFTDNNNNLWIENFHFTDPQQGFNIRIIKNGDVKSLRTLLPFTLSCPSTIRLCGMYNNEFYGIGFNSSYSNFYNRYTIIKINPSNWNYELINFNSQLTLGNFPNAINTNYLNFPMNGADLSIDLNGNIVLINEGSGINPNKILFRISILNMEPDSVLSSILDINNLHAYFSVGNTFFADSVRAGAIVASDVSTARIANSGGLWLGGIDGSGNLKVSATSNGLSDFSPGPIDTVNFTSDSIIQQQYNRIWKINRATIDYFNYQFSIGNVTSGAYTIPDEISSWPANGNATQSKNLAPYIDVNGDGYYNPLDGDHPLIRGDQQLFWISNDIGNIHPVTNSPGPIGVEVHTSVYGFNCPDNYGLDSLLKHTIFIHFDIYHRSNTVLYESYFGINNQSSLGNPSDDHIGFHVMKNYYHNYNGDNFDEGTEGFQLNPPTFNCILLKGPSADSADGIDNDRDFITDEMWETISPSKFLSYISDFTNIGIPLNSQHYYGYMDGKWKDGTTLTYGGTGEGGTVQCDFMFPGDSDPMNLSTHGVDPGFSWSETNPFPASAPNAGYLHQSVFSMGKFTMMPNEKRSFDIAYLLTWYKTDSNSINTSVFLNNLIVDSLQSMFNSNSFPVFDTTSSTYNIPDVQIFLYPNPAQEYISIVAGDSGLKFKWNICDINGVKLKSGICFGNERIRIAELSSGIYLLNIQGEKGMYVRRIVKL